MSLKRATAKLFALGLCGLVAPCLAFAVDAPIGGSLERVDTTLLGAGQETVSAALAPAWAVQVGAFADRDAAEARLARIAERASSELSRATRLVTPLVWDDGHMLYRARFGGMDAPSAQAACAILNRRGESCFVVAEEPAKPDRGNIVEAAADAQRAARRADTVEAVNAQLIATVPVTDPLTLVASTISPSLPGSASPMNPAKVAANTVRTSLLSSASQVNNDELSDMRGGFFTAAGAHFDFGASI